MGITSDATNIKLVTFQLKGESQVWWDWVKASRNLEATTWEEFHELFMGKYFPMYVRHAKAREFVELKHGTVTVLEYVAKFIELARFTDDYVAINMAKVGNFEDGLKLSIQGKIMGLLLQDIDLMLRTTTTIKRELDNVWSIRDAGVKNKRKESQPSSSSSRKK